MLKNTLLAILIMSSFSFCDIIPDEEIILVNDSPTENNVIPDFSTVFPKAENFYAVEVSSNRVYSLYSFEGKEVVLIFWAAYDRYSLKTLPHLVELQEKYAKKGLKVIGIAIDRTEEVKKNLKQNPENGKILQLIGSVRLAKQYNVWGLPTIYILDKNLSVRKSFSGYVNKKTLEKEIHKLL